MLIYDKQDRQTLVWHVALGILEIEDLYVYDRIGWAGQVFTGLFMLIATRFVLKWPVCVAEIYEAW